MLLDFSTFFKDGFDDDEWKDFLSCSNVHGSNCLLLAAKFRGEYFLKNLFKFIEIELGIDGLRNMLQEHDVEGNNIFMCASRRNVSFIKYFLKRILFFDQYKMLYDEFTIDKEDESSDEYVEISNCTTDDEM